MTALTDTIRDAIATAYAVDGSTRDAIIVGLVTGHKLTLNAATKAYAEWAKEEGIAPTLTSHKTEALAELREQFDAGSWDHKAVQDMVIVLADQYGIAESTARDYCKAYSEELGVAHPVQNPREAIFEWFKNAGDDASKESFMKFAVDHLGRSQSNANEYWKGYELHLFLIS
jgi:hypothetical protein